MLGPPAPPGARLIAIFSFAMALSCGHKKEDVGVVVGPPLTIAPTTASPFPDVDASAPPANAPPVTATFIDLSAAGTPITVRTCEQVVTTVVRGKGSALGDELAVGDFLVTQGEGPLLIKGEGLAVVAAVRTEPCTPRGAKEAPPPLGHRTVRANAAPELTWAGGKMHAHLDVETELTGAFAGRLSGAAPIPEHAHEGSWEIVCTVSASGIVTVDGQARRIGPRQIVMIPPSSTHSFTPDDGTQLSGIVFYWPRGPEQRFRDLDRQQREPHAPRPPASNSAPKRTKH